MIDLRPWLPEVPDPVVARLVAGRRVLIASHENPDADTLGAALGVAAIVELGGGRVQLLCADPVPALYGFLPGMDRFRIDPDPSFEPDLLVVCDCGTLYRLGHPRLQTAAGGHIVYSELRAADHVETATQAAHSEGIIDLLSQSESAAIVILFKEVDHGTTRVSVRTRDGGIDATTLTGAFGGGGHARAAGATVGAPPAQAERRGGAAARPPPPPAPRAR